MMLITAAIKKAAIKNLATKKNNIIAKDKPKNILNGFIIINFLWLNKWAILRLYYSWVPKKLPKLPRTIDLKEYSYLLDKNIRENLNIILFI